MTVYIVDLLQNELKDAGLGKVELSAQLAEVATERQVCFHRLTLIAFVYDRFTLYEQYWYLINFYYSFVDINRKYYCP